MKYLLTTDDGQETETIEIDSWDLLQLMSRQPWERLEQNESITIIREDYEA